MNQQIHRLGRSRLFTAWRLRSESAAENGQPAEGYLPAVAAAMVLQSPPHSGDSRDPGENARHSACTARIAVGRRNQPDINRDSLVATDTLELRAPESHAADAPASSARYRQFEKQRAAVRLNKAPPQHLSAPVNAPFRDRTIQIPVRIR